MHRRTEHVQFMNVLLKKNNFENCGQCKALPCSIWQSTRDPAFSDEEFAESIASRVKALKG